MDAAGFSNVSKETLGVYPWAAMEALRLGEAVVKVPMVVAVAAVVGRLIVGEYMGVKGWLAIDCVGVCRACTGVGLPPSRGLDSRGGDDGRDDDGCFSAERRIGMGRGLWVDASPGWLVVVVAISDLFN